MLCGQCGFQSDDTSRFCPQCGNPLTPNDALAAPLSEAPAEAPVFKLILADDPYAAPGDDPAPAANEVPGGGATAFVSVSRNAAYTDWSVRTERRGFPRGLKIALRTVCILVLATAVGFGASVFAGREIRQLLQSDEDYARSVLVSGAEEVLFAGVDYFRDMHGLFDFSELDFSSEMLFDASVPDAYLRDVLIHYDAYSEPLFQELRLVGASRLDLSMALSIDRYNPAFSASGSWKVQGEDMVNAAMTVVGSSMYLTVPELFSETLGVDLSGPGYSGLDFSDLPAPTAALQMLADWGLTLPRLKPTLSEMLEAAVPELDYFVTHDETVDINGKSAKLDTIVVRLTEKDWMRAAAAALRVLADDEAALEILVELYDAMPPEYRERSFSAQEVAQDLEDIIRELESYSNGDDWVIPVPVKLYVNSANDICGVSYENSNAGREFRWIAVSGTGYAFDYRDGGQSLRLFGELDGLVTLKGDANLYSNYFGNVAEGKLCDFTLRSTLTSPSLTVHTKMSDVRALLEAFGEEDAAAQLAFYENAEFTLSSSSSSRSSAFALEFADPSRSARAAFSFKSERKDADIQAPDVPLMAPDAMEQRLGQAEFQANLDAIGQKLADMGYDIPDMLPGGIPDFPSEIPEIPEMPGVPDIPGVFSLSSLSKIS
jgi:hypothetical protein